MRVNFTKKKTDEGLRCYLLWGLVAIELLMSFSFLGYIHIQPISLTIVYIPVLAAGCLMGPWEATLVGIVFGLASMWKASSFYISAGDMMFSPIMSGKPIQSILMSVGARALFGLVTGILYAAAKRRKHPTAGIFLVTSVGRIIHSFLVYWFMGILFPEAGYHVSNALDSILNLEFFPFFLVQNVIVLTCYAIQNSKYARRLGDRIRMVNRMGIGIIQSKKTMALFIVLTFLASFSVAWYFISRIESVMNWHGVPLSDQIAYDIVHVQIQFLLGILSLFAIVILVIILSLKNFNYLYYEAQLDGLTGIASRGQFFLLGEKILANRKIKQESIMVS